MDKRADFWKKFFAGLIIGIGGILPGVSGGILAVALGLYRRMLEAVYSFLKAPRENFLFLLPIGIGGVVGFLAVAQILGAVLDNYRLPVMFLFIGMVLGGVPSLYKEGAKGTGFRARYLLATAVGISLIYVLSLLEKSGVLVDLSLTFATAMMAGGIIAIGVIVPGISTAFLLMHLGLYDDMLLALNRFDVLILAGVGIGVVIVALIVIKGVRTLFDRYPNYSYFGVMGFLCGSVVLIFPGLGQGWGNLFYLALIMAGFFAAHAMERAMEQEHT